MANSLEESGWMAVVSVRGKQRHLRILPERLSNILLNLPVDIWLSIFDAISMAENYPTTCTTKSSIMSISGVCQYWRHLAQTTPTLWSRIRIPVTPTSYHTWTPVVLKTHLEYSEDALLDVSIDGQYQADDWSRFHKRCHTSHYIVEPYGVDVWKKRPSDDELLTFQVKKWQSHISCWDWLNALEKRHQVNWKLLNRHAHRIRSLTMRLQTMESFSYSEWRGWLPPYTPEMHLGDETTHFSELTHLDIACNGETSLYACIYSIGWLSSTDRMPKLRSLMLRNVDVGAHIDHWDHWPTPWEPVPMQARLHVRLSGHEQLNNLSLCPMSLRVYNHALSASTLNFTALQYLRIEDFRNGPRQMSHRMQPSWLTVKALLLHLSAPFLVAIDIRGTHTLQGFLEYLKSVSETELSCNLSSLQQVRLTGEVRQNFGHLRLMFSVMPTIRRASFSGNVCQYIVESKDIWPELEGLSINYNRACNESAIQKFVLNQRGSGLSSLRRVYMLRQDMRPKDQGPQLIRRWVEWHGFIYDDWELDRDAWPWNQ